MSTRRLTSSCIAVPPRQGELRRQMFELFRRHYDDVSFEVFSRDLEEKEHVIVLRDGGGVLRGFSTVRTFELVVDGAPLRLLFSGDTIIEQGWWGEQALGRAWSALAGSIRAQSPLPLYWLLLSKGHRTYLYLPLFFHQFYPRHDTQAPPREKAIIDAFASWKYGRDYDPERGVVAFAAAPGRLREDLAGVGPHRLRSEHVRFFLAANPDYAAGHELVCLAPLEANNLKLFARQCFERGLSMLEEASA